MQTALKDRRRSYDHAKEHLGGDFPASLPAEQAYVHIGMYLGWIIENRLYSEFYAEEASTAIFRFRRREISCTILSEIWDGHLNCDMLNKAGNNFTVFYYTTGLYRQDYEEVLGADVSSVYHVADTWRNYEKMKLRIAFRYSEWRKLKCLLRDVPLASITGVSV